MSIIKKIIKGKGSFIHQFLLYHLLVIISIFYFVCSYHYFNENLIYHYSHLLQPYEHVEKSYEYFADAILQLHDYLRYHADEKYNEYERSMELCIEEANQLYTYESLNVDQQMICGFIATFERFDQACETIMQSEASHASYEEVSKLIQTQVEQRIDDLYFYVEKITTQLEVKQQRLARNKQILQFGSLLFLALIGFLFFMILKYFFYNVVKPIDYVFLNLRSKDPAQMSFQNIESSSTEVSKLCSSLDELVEKSNRNIENERAKAELEQKLLQQENDNLKKDELLIQSELKMLQNQINPHFLFNTLNVISCLISEKQDEKAIETIIEISQLLRYGLEMQNSISTVEQELKAIEHYINIQKLRLSDRIEFVVNCKHREALKNIKIPGMILQPLVENAIKHGLKDFIQNGEVEIFVEKNQDQLFIEVSDNGIGMPQEDMNKKFAMYQSSNYNEPHFGLYNVIRRLQMYFHDKVQLDVITEVDCGFSFKIAIDCSNEMRKGEIA